MMSETHSEVFRAADSVVERWCALSPMSATAFGVPGREEELDDFSPESVDRTVEFWSEVRQEISNLEAKSDDDSLALLVMRERVESTIELERHREPVRTFGVISSPAMEIRQIFEMMPSSTSGDAEVIAKRLLAVESSIESWRHTLVKASATKEFTASRHATGVAKQMQEIAQGGFRTLVTRVAQETGVDLESSGLASAANSASAAYNDVAQWLEGVYAPMSEASPYVGVERYRRWVRHHTGLDLEPEETYEWGWQELASINARMWTIAESLFPSASSLAEVARNLDVDPRYVVHGTDELLARLRSFTDATIERLGGREFTIDDRVRFCDVRLAPEGSAAAPYYIPPSEDLSRPGTTWFPTLGKDEFAWWRQVSTWYHEAVPGHHLEEGTIVINSHRLSRFQRLMAWNSGWGEGWALYAEQLMDELGGYSEPAYEFGYLQGQALRAARVVVDIGMHLQLSVPKDFGDLGQLGDVAGQTWTPEMAVATLVERAVEPVDFAESEVERYLAIPGQAISYKVGQREWLAAREEMRVAQGDSFSLREFHDRALALGPIGLGDFREVLRR